MNRRRQFLKLAGAGAAMAIAGHGRIARAAKGAHVIVIGGGFGGATCAKYLRLTDPGIEVTLIEPATHYITCPFSNLVLGGLRTMGSITQGYDALRKRHGVHVLHQRVRAIDPGGKKVTLDNGKSLRYDRLVVSPGISFKWDAIRGYNEAAAQVMPHAWQAGAQTLLLKKQLQAMAANGTVILAAPANPFRCPPGPYERASLIAHYLKQHKPRAKILILDAKDKFSKQPLFQAAWDRLYPGMIEWVGAAKGGAVVAVDAKRLRVETDIGTHTAHVANIIPPQAAGDIALASGLADDSGFCPVDPYTFESTIHPDVYVIGDAAIAGALPKSGFAANSEGKMAAAAIVAAFRGEAPPVPSLVNTCYSVVGPQYGISVAGVYRLVDGALVEVEGAGGVSPKDAGDDVRAAEARYAAGWYASIAADTWG